MTKLLILFGMVVAGLGAYAQGSVQFANIAYGSGGKVLDAPFFAEDCTTRIAGTEWMAQLWAGLGSNSLAAVGTGTPFLTGAGAGYFIGGVRTIPSIAPGSIAFVQVRFWDDTAVALRIERGAWNWTVRQRFMGVESWCPR
jgi:hypothetical protein